MTKEEAMSLLTDKATPNNHQKVETADEIIGVTFKDVKETVREIGKNQELADALWGEPVLEMKQLAIFLMEPEKVGFPKIEDYMKDIDNVILCQLLARIVIYEGLYFNACISRWAGDERLYYKYIAFYLMYMNMFITEDIALDMINPHLDLLKTHANDDRKDIQTIIATILITLQGKSKEVREEANKIVKDFKKSHSQAKNIIVEKIKES